LGLMLKNRSIVLWTIVPRLMATVSSTGIAGSCILK